MFFAYLLLMIGSFVNTTPEYLYKVLSQDEWQKSQHQEHVVPSTMDTDFIHLSTEEQLPRIIQKFWNNQSYVVLKLTPKDLKGRLAFEVNPGGTNLYYHLYNGFIPLSAVKDISSTPSH